MYEQSATKGFLTVGAGDAPGGDGCVHGASNVETVEGQVGRQHSFGPNIEGAVYAAAQYGHLPSPFLASPLSSPLVLKDPLRTPSASRLSQSYIPERSAAPADSSSGVKITRPS